MSHPFVLHNTLGANLVGLIVASMLHGVSIIQAWGYYGHQQDTWVIKSLVGVVVTFDTVHQALISHTVYTYTVTHWGDPAKLNRLVKSGLIEILFTCSTAFLVQGYLTSRVWRLSNGNIWLTGIAGSMIFGEFTCSLVFFGLAAEMDTFAQMAKLNRLSIIVTSLAAMSDVFIAGVLCFLLNRSRTGFRRSNSMINKLIIYAVSTGTLTSLCAVASLISITAAGDSFIYMAFYFCLCRLYTNSLLATLNARKTIFNSEDNSASGNLTVSLREFPRQGNLTSGRGQNIDIQINTKKELVPDLINDCGKDMDKTESGDSTREGFGR